VTGVPDPARQAFQALLTDLQTRVRALETQQQVVITDPTGPHGDPAHNNAVVVIGNLKPICAIAAFGIASYHTGSWVQL
jgi:hypothetical protein